MDNKTYVLLDELVDSAVVFAPAIYDLKQLDEKVPEGFNAVCIRLDGKIDADLDWKLQRQAAVRFIASGLKILWELDLGLFSHLKQSISDQAQFLAINLSLDHFLNKLWLEFHKHTIGICLYRGSLDFQVELQHDKGLAATYYEQGKSGATVKALYYRDVATEYLNLLVGKLPERLTPVLFLNSQNIQDKILIAQLLDQDKFGKICRAVTDASTLFGFVSREKPGSIQKDHIKVALCLPSTELSSEEVHREIGKTIDQLSAAKIPYRIIPEESLTTEWDGIDYLIVIDNGVSLQGKRKLNGFSAAGGTIIIVGAPFNEWLQRQLR